MTHDAPGPRVERAIDFRRLTSVLHNDFRLGGAGSIVVEPDRVVVRGARRDGWVRRPAELVFAAERIHDATSYGTLVWFFVDPAPGESGRPRRMVVYARSDADAQALFDALPQRMSPARAQSRAEQDAFLDDLQRQTPRVLVTPVLVAINVAVFAAMLAGGAGLWGGHPEVHVRWGANYGALTAAGEWWRLLANIFLHFGIVHLALNMWALFDAGRLAERLFGHARFLALYLVSGAGGSIASLWWNPAVNSAGASGAVFGVIGALLVYSLDRRNRVPLAAMRDHRFTLLLFLGYSLAFGFMHANIDNAAHLGGLAAGALAALAWPRPLGAPTPPGATGRFVAMALIFSGGLVAAAVPVLRSADASNEEARFRSLAPRFLPVEQGLDMLTRQTLEGLRLGRIAPGQAASQLQSLAAQWAQLNRDVGEIRLAAGSPHADLRTQMIRLAGLRSEGLSRLADAIVADDRAMAQAALAVLAESQKVELNVQRELARLRPGR